MTQEMQKKIASMWLKTLAIVVTVGAFVGFCVAPWFIELGFFLVFSSAWAMAKIGERG